MSKFEQYILNEKFFTGFHDSGYYREVYINPTSSDIKEILKEQKDNKIKGVRLGFDGDNNLYAWNVYTLHSVAEKKLDKRFLLKIDYALEDGTFETSIYTSEHDIKRLDFDIVTSKLEEAFPNDKQQIKDFLGNLKSDEEEQIFKKRKPYIK